MVKGHGMLVIGSGDHVYFLHLAMHTMEAHRVQLIIDGEMEAGPNTEIIDRTFVGDDVTLDKASPHAVYLADRNHLDNGLEVYTIRPTEAFVLRELQDGERTTFRGDIVRGHFELEPDAPTVVSDVRVRVRDILHNRSLVEPEHGEPHPLNDGNLEYLMFGGGDEYFLSHRITFHQTPTNNAFHQLFRLDDATAAALRFDLPTLAATVRLTGSAATAEGRLPVAGGSFTGRVTGLVDHSDTALDVELGTGEELYLEMLM